MRRWSEEIKTRARELRLNKASFGEIQKEIHVAKSTLFEWVKDIDRPVHLQPKNRREWFGRMRLLAVAALKKKRENEIEVIIEKAKSEVDSWNFLYSKDVQKALLSLLYWAEGQKLPERGSPVKFANTDPKLVLLFVTLLKNCYDIDEDKIKIALHLHWYHKETQVKEFWKKLLGVEGRQFYKIYRKKRSQTKRFRKNFMGICFVTYHSVDLRQEIVHTAFAIQEKIGKIAYSGVAPIA